MFWDRAFNWLAMVPITLISVSGGCSGRLATGVVRLAGWVRSDGVQRRVSRSGAGIDGYWCTVAVGRAVSSSCYYPKFYHEIVADYGYGQVTYVNVGRCVLIWRKM